MQKNRFLGISFMVAALLFATSASAFVLLNPPRRWFDTAQNIIVDNTGMASVTDSDNGINAAKNAVTAWNGSGVNVVSSSVGAPNIVAGDNLSHMVFSDPFRICKGQCLAATTTGFYGDGRTGTCGGLSVVEIDDSDVVFNTRYDYTTTGEPDGCSGEIFLESVVTHEVGHVIGLGHSGTGAALMAPSVSYCNNKMLHGDDIAGRNALYDCNLTIDGGGDPPGTCDLGQPGDSCNSNADCCSDKCKGKPGSMTCR